MSLSLANKGLRSISKAAVPLVGSFLHLRRGRFVAGSSAVPQRFGTVLLKSAEPEDIVV